MRIIHSYLLKEFFSAFILALSVLTFVMVLGNIIYLIGLVVSKGVSVLIILQLFLYSLPYSIQFILPIAIMAGLLLSLGRLSSDNEIISIRSSGMSTLKVILPFLVLGLIFTLFSILLHDRITPQSHFKTRQLMQEIGSKNPAAALEPGIFINTFEKYIIFVYEINGNKFRNIRIYEPQGEDKPPRTIIAKRGEFITVPDQNILKLKLIDGTSDEINPADPNNLYKINFHTYFMTLDFAKNKTNAPINKKPKDMTMRELWSEIHKLRKLKIYDGPIATELHKKIAISFSSIVFFLLGVPLGIITRRREKAANIALAFLIVGLYFILTLFVEALSKEGNLAPSSGMWIPNIIFGSIGIYLSRKLCAF
ncbi:MAG: LPS export ABC transporter permease LptF [Candidatus Omnitrophica bacterium]|nr:LPS export ABC transporter permease LptF [Candidatus Omnitrophota bacterium]MDD5351951.1 LPS export ABC transporter permease LptF [Candidatus Omnitrophota bacterium]MDD5550777.1 LPS export ABC transporter permease LptF [Candidatus Omnitrophota bacterium]